MLLSVAEARLSVDIPSLILKEEPERTTTRRTSRQRFPSMEGVQVSRMRALRYRSRWVK